MKAIDTTRHSWPSCRARCQRLLQQGCLAALSATTSCCRGINPALLHAIPSRSQSAAGAVPCFCLKHYYCTPAEQQPNLNAQGTEGFHQEHACCGSGGSGGL